MKEIMLDIETMDTLPTAAIMQIGACYFDRESGKIGKTFFANIDLNSCIEKGLTVNGDTIYWWLSQSDSARESMLKKPRGKVENVLKRFRKFANGATTIWCHASYDFPIVTNAMVACGIDPMNFLIVRDIRTISDLSGMRVRDFKRDGVHHTALDDCSFQVKYIRYAIDKIFNGELTAK